MAYRIDSNFIFNIAVFKINILLDISNENIRSSLKAATLAQNPHSAKS